MPSASPVTSEVPYAAEQFRAHFFTRPKRLTGPGVRSWSGALGERIGCLRDENEADWTLFWFSAPVMLSSQSPGSPTGAKWM